VAPSSFQCSYPREKGEGGGCCSHSESKREAADGGAHQVWAIHGSTCGQRDTTGGRPEGERQCAWAEVIAAKAVSGESRSGRSARRCSVDRGAAGKHEEENVKGKPSMLSS
jgi:hypothetical protein